LHTINNRESDAHKSATNNPLHILATDFPLLIYQQRNNTGEFGM
jgi:hypothetical protein